MINTGANKQAFLIVTTQISKHVIRVYNKLKRATSDLGDVYLLYHTDSGRIPIGLEGVKIETFTSDILYNMGYKAIKKTLVPGSNHFPVLKFYLKHPQYSHYWCIEDDVDFNGKWNSFFKEVSSRGNYDFITSHIRRYTDIPEWSWWDTLKAGNGEFDNSEMLNSFNPIYKISNRALSYIDTSLKGGFSGHHEVLLPTILKKAGFDIADFGSEENHVTPILSFCTLTTMRWRPVFFTLGGNGNKLYHPVKPSITFRQVLIYVKRTLLNRKKYFT